MPLNTQKLSPVRHAMMLIVMLLIFVGSLGAAWGVVKYRNSQEVHVPALALPAFAPADPPSYLAAVPEITVLPHGSYTGTVGGKRRTLLFLELAGEPETFTQDSVEIFGNATGPDLHFNQSDLEVRDSVLASHAAITISGSSSDAKYFAFQRSAMINFKLVAVVYFGDAPATDNDLALFEQACRQVAVPVIRRK